jgi:hypothetical protein
MGIHYKGSQGQTERAVELQEEEDEVRRMIQRVFKDAVPTSDETLSLLQRQIC